MNQSKSQSYFSQGNEFDPYKRLHLFHINSVTGLKRCSVAAAQLMKPYLTIYMGGMVNNPKGIYIACNDQKRMRVDFSAGWMSETFSAATIEWVFYCKGHHKNQYEVYNMDFFFFIKLNFTSGITNHICCIKVRWHNRTIDCIFILTLITFRSIYPLLFFLVQFAGAAEYTSCISAGRGETPPTSLRDMILNNLMVRLLELWGMQGTPLVPSLPGLLWPGVVAADRVLFVDQIELNCVFMLNWLVWNRTVLHRNCALMLNWTIFTFNWINKLLIFIWIDHDT